MRNRYLLATSALLCAVALVAAGIAWAGDDVPADKAAPATTEAPAARAPATATTSPIHTILAWVGSQVMHGEPCCPSTEKGEKAWRGWFAQSDGPLASLRTALVKDGWNADRTIGFFKVMAARSAGKSECGECPNSKCCGDCAKNKATGAAGPLADPAAAADGSCAGKCKDGTCNGKCTGKCTGKCKDGTCNGKCKDGACKSCKQDGSCKSCKQGAAAPAGDAGKAGDASEQCPCTGKPRSECPGCGKSDCPCGKKDKAQPAGAK